jgi:hypothetical protein
MWSNKLKASSGSKACCIAENKLSEWPDGCPNWSISKSSGECHLGLGPNASPIGLGGSGYSEGKCDILFVLGRVFADLTN